MRGKSIGITSWGAGSGEGTSLQRKQEGGETLPGTTDSSLGRLHRTTFCALKHTRSSHHPAIYLDKRMVVRCFFGST